MWSMESRSMFKFDAIVLRGPALHRSSDVCAFSRANAMFMFVDMLHIVTV